MIPMKTELLTTIKRNASRVIAEMRRSKEPVMITEHGRPAALLVDPEEWRNTQRRLSILEGIARGETAIQDGAVMEDDAARARFSKWLD